jgi:hypothetical protein
MNPTPHPEGELVSLRLWCRRVVVRVPRGIYQLAHLFDRRATGMVHEGSNLEGEKWLLLVRLIVAHTDGTKKKVRLMSQCFAPPSFSHPIHLQFVAFSLVHKLFVR